MTTNLAGGMEILSELREKRNEKRMMFKSLNMAAYQELEVTRVSYCFANGWSKKFSVLVLVSFLLLSFSAFLGHYPLLGDFLHLGAQAGAAHRLFICYYYSFFSGKRMMRDGIPKRIEKGVVIFISLHLALRLKGYHIIRSVHP
jgi:hypothetical protein